MDRTMQWFIAGIIVLIIGIVRYMMSQQIVTLILAAIILVYAIFRKVTGK